MRTLLISTLVVVLLGATASNGSYASAARPPAAVQKAPQSRSSASPPLPFVGFFDDYGMFTSPDPAQPAETVQMAKNVGLDAERIYIRWSRYHAVPSAADKQEVCNAATQASLAGFKVFMFNMTPLANTFPIDDPSRAAYWQAMSAYLDALYNPTTGCVSGNYVMPDGQQVPKLAELWVEPVNEPNITTFCSPQTDTTHDFCASLTVSLRQYLYPRIKNAGVQYGVTMTVVGGALSSHHGPLQFLQAECRAMTAQHVTSPNMDVFGFHPYPLPGSTNPLSGMLMYAQLVAQIQKCYGRAIPVVYDEFAIQTMTPATVDSQCASHQVPSILLTDDAQRAWIYKLALGLARTQGVLGLMFFQLVDDQCVDGGWQAGFYYWNGEPKPFLSGLSQAITAAQLPSTSTSP